MGGGGGSQISEQRKVAEDQLALERERIDLERKARETAQQELGLLQEQLQSQRNAYEQQLGILKEQQAASAKASEEYKKQLAEQTALQEQATARSQSEAARASNARKQEQRRAIEGVLTGAIRSSKRNRVTGILSNVTLPSYTAQERRSVLSR